MRHRVYFGRGEQSLVTVPHRGGQPVRASSATYAILDTRYGAEEAEHIIVAAGTAATVDPLSTTLTARAGRGAEDRRALTLVSTTGLVRGRQYLLEGAKGQGEIVTIIAAPSGTVARTEVEIGGDYLTGATLRGVEVTAAFPAIEADDDDNLDGLPFIVAWTFDGLPPLRESVYAERGEEAQLATLADLLKLDPAISLIGGDRIDPAAALGRAHEDLRTALQQAGVSEADRLTGKIGRDYVIYRAAYLCMLADPEPNSRKLDHYEKQADQLQTSLLLGVPKPDVVDLDKADEAARAPSPGALFKQFGF